MCKIVSGFLLLSSKIIHSFLLNPNAEYMPWMRDRSFICISINTKYFKSRMRYGKIVKGYSIYIFKFSSKCRGLFPAMSFEDTSFIFTFEDVNDIFVVQ